MERFFVKGLNNRKKIEGILPVMGAKNAALKAQATSVLFKNEVLLHNMPFIKDVLTTNELLNDLGITTEYIDNRSLKLKPQKNLKKNLDTNIAKKLRSSIVLVGPILAREGEISFPHPGGCIIGQRPIDVFLEAFQKMGAKLEIKNDLYLLRAKKLHGTEIFFKKPSVTATETLMMTAILINGTTILSNCACEPEIAQLAEFLNSAGANIVGAGTHTIIIHGKKQLLNHGVYNVPPDRIEAGSFAAIAALCGKKIKITNCEPDHTKAMIHTLKNLGVDMKIGKNFISINTPQTLKAIEIKTHEYPGFPTDLQAPFSVILTQAKGRSLIFETVFDGRLNYLEDLQRMGANVVVCDPHRAIIQGPTKLRGREMESPDLRAGLAFLIAALVAEGNSIIHNIHNIDRGYEKIEDRLNAVGANIKRI